VSAKIDFRAWMLGGVLAVAMAGPGAAVDGVIEINQARALAGDPAAGDPAGFPVVINSSGSYRLTGSLSVPPDTDGIVVEAAYVTLDLNGFSLVGSTTECCDDGIRAYPSAPNFRVLNGSVRGFYRGIIVGDRVAIESVRVAQSNDSGISTGDYALVADCAVEGSGYWGIHAGLSSIVRGCTVFGNHDGIAASGSLISGNAVYGNTSTGIGADSGSTVVDNTVRGNGGAGIYFFGLVGGGEGGAYARNVVSGNNSGGTQVYFGVQIGSNLCGTALCP